MANHKALPDTAWTGGNSSHLEPTVNFDYDAIDRGNPLAAELSEASCRDKAEVGAELLSGVLIWIWRSDLKLKNPRSAFRRFVVISALMRPGLLGSKSYSEIGKQLGCTKQALSAIAKEFERDFGLRFRRSHDSTNGDKIQ